MSYKSLLFCLDQKTARIVTQVLTDVDFRVEPCNEPFAAVKKLMAEHFDAVVVDCENEQNAALLFKSAHNSEVNQASLAVAVVEGQSGVAKAFRIGANLVLTKPINVEQCKGTLRVARGLLRKSEGSRPASSTPQAPGHSNSETAAHSQASATSIPPGPPAMSLPPQRAATPFPISSATFESDEKSGPSLGTAETGLGTQSSPNAPPMKEYPWKPMGGPMAGSMTSALQHAAEATGKSRSAPIDADEEVAPIRDANSMARPAGFGITPGAAAAPAPAKAASAPKEEASVQELEPPVFSSLDSEQARIGSSGGAKKFVIAAAILVAVCAAAYILWPKVSSEVHPQTNQHLAAPVSPPAPAVPQLAPNTAAESPSASPANDAPSAKSTNDQATTVSTPDIVLSTAEAKPSPGKTTKSPVAEKIAADVVRPEPLVVKTQNSQRAAVPAAPPEAVEAPAPGLLSSNSNSQEGAVSGIVTAPPADVPQAAPHSMNVSQGVAQGLLMKRIQPIYPTRALQGHIQGAVQLSASISKDGNITNVNVVSGDPILSKAAVDAVKQWKYRPYLLDGQPVEIQTQITVNFKLP